jgi:uncharacterized phage-associated protein
MANSGADTGITIAINGEKEKQTYINSKNRTKPSVFVQLYAVFDIFTQQHKDLPLVANHRSIGLHRFYGLYGFNFSVSYCFCHFYLYFCTTIGIGLPLNNLMNGIVNIEKVANTLVFLTERIGETYLTKALKLLYIIDELSVKETGVPFTWLEYKAWEKGPVAESVYDELRYNIHNINSESDFSKFIAVKKVENPVANEFESFLISPVVSFTDDEFSDYELQLLDRVIEKYGKYSGKELINILHEEGSLWHRVVKENNLELEFALKQRKSDCTIPFTVLIKDDELKQMAFRSAFDSLQFERSLID